MIRKIKLSGVVVGFVGILIALLDLRGCFIDPEKAAFAETVMGSVKSIPRSTPGFESFLVDFPPPPGIAPSAVTHIGDKAMRWDTSPAESLAVVYVVGGQRTALVARLDQVRDWAYDTPYGLISWIIAALGWAIYAAIELLEPHSGRAA